MNDESKEKERSCAVVHSAVTVGSEERAGKLFGELFGMTVVKEFSVDEGISEALFGFSGRAKIIVYDAGGTTVEAFVCPERVRGSDRYDHLCLEVPDRGEFLGRAAAMELAINRYEKNGREVVFIRDWDGNFYEIKEAE